MTLTVRKGSTILSPQMQVSAYYQYDFATRRAVRVVETIVPSINQAEVPTGMYYAADRFYFPIGAIVSATYAPPAVNSITGTLQQWDATEKVQYATFRSGSAAPSGATVTRFIYPTGTWGAGTSYTPKNADVTTAVICFKARFTDNIDYATDAGVGAMDGSTPLAFSSTSNHFIQVLRNSGNWELGTCDGSTISQSSAAGADGSWHEFKLEWEVGTIRLYVDDTLTITKTTNLPTSALRVNIRGTATQGVDIVDYLVRWNA